MVPFGGTDWTSKLSTAAVQKLLMGLSSEILLTIYSKFKKKRREVIVRWKIKNKKTGQIVDGAERGRYDAVWVSTAAHGSTIFWSHPKEYITATGGKEYK